MHKSSVVWFDTAGCFNPNDFFSNSLWGGVNGARFAPTSGWSKGVMKFPDGKPLTAPDTTGTPVDNYPKDSAGNINWGVNMA
jgi:hypothetical protein